MHAKFSHLDDDSFLLEFAGRLSDEWEPGRHLSESDSPQVDVYPNPSQRGMVKLEMKGIAAAAITVYHLSGREAGIGVKSIEKGVHELNFSNASPGVYMVVISHASGVITRRQVVYD